MLPFPFAVDLGPIDGPIVVPLSPPAPTFFEHDLVGWLSSTLGLVCYPGHIPQGSALPALCFLSISGAADSILAGSTGLVETLMQIDVASTDYFDVGGISLTLLKALHGFHGWMGSTAVELVLFETERTIYDAGVGGSDLGVHTKQCEYSFQYFK